MSFGASSGLLLVLVCLSLGLLLWAGLRLFSRDKSSSRTDSPAPFVFESHSSDAVIIVQMGGRVEYINSSASSLFGLT